MKIDNLTISPKNEYFANMFSTFFHNSSRMASTYKPVFLRALLDVGDLADSNQSDKLIGKNWLKKEDGRLLINLNFIAVRFAKYYWDMEYSFHLRQSQDRQDANITRFIREKHIPKKKPPTLISLTKDDMDSFRKLVISKSLRPEVLVHLKTDMDDLYKKIDANTISVDEDLVNFLHIHKTSLRYGLNYVISKYLEKINYNIPRITTKVEYDPDDNKRPSLRTETKIRMERLQDSRCFYCECKMPKYHVDHVIPFNFVFSTEWFNCVLACPQCNCTKSDTLPKKKLFCNVLERNADSTNFKDQKHPYDESKYQILYDVCMTDYNGPKLFDPPKCN